MTTSQRPLCSTDLWMCICPDYDPVIYLGILKVLGATIHHAETVSGVSTMSHLEVCVPRCEYLSVCWACNFSLFWANILKKNIKLRNEFNSVICLCCGIVISSIAYSCFSFRESTKQILCLLSGIGVMYLVCLVH